MAAIKCYHRRDWPVERRARELTRSKMSFTWVAGQRSAPCGALILPVSMLPAPLSINSALNAHEQTKARR